MNRQLLKKLLNPAALTPARTPQPPHVLTEDRGSYSIILNLLGIERKDIAVDVNVERREVTVLARKESPMSRKGFYWVFGVPGDGFLAQASARFRGGALELMIPRARAS